jgi:subtilisin family serine protease
VPLIIRRLWWVAAAIALSILLTIACRSTLAQAPSSLPEALAIRPTGIPLTSPEVVRAIANAAPPTLLDRGDYPDAGHFTPRRVAQVLCGTPSAPYFDLLQTRNELSAAELDIPLGDKIYKIKFPSCLYIKIFPDNKPFSYKVNSGDSYSTIRQKFTGVQGNTNSNAHFFSVAPENIHAPLPVGTPLTIPYITSTTVLPKVAAEAVMSAVSAEAGPQSVNVVPPSAGEIISFAHNGNGLGSTPTVPKECGMAIVHPFSASDVEDAFAFALARARDVDNNLPAPFQVEVMVVDNGFFGAKWEGNQLVFRDPEFRKGFFDTSDFGGNLGPKTGTMPDLVFPLNYANNLTPNGALSGHGTHVTGLVLGGPDLLNFRGGIFGVTGPAWLKVTEMNIGRGTDLLLPGSEQQIRTGVLLRDTSLIVNMSITYDGTSEDVQHSFGFMNEGDQQFIGTKHLYVVAAGNDNGDNAQKYYPAALGGVDRSTTVITVAALDPTGALTQFTNVGPKVADVAAPGCNIASWIDDTSPAVPLSGTSQAAPIVSFEAALIRGLTKASPSELKERIIASGDLLEDEKQQELLSAHVKVNIVKSLYFSDDYVEYRESDTPGAPVHKILGSVRSVEGLMCSDGQGKIDISNIAAYKEKGTHAFGYQRDSSNRITICPLATPPATAKLVVKPNYEVGPGYPCAHSTEFVEIPMDSVDDIVMHMPNAKTFATKCADQEQHGPS